MCIHGNYVLQVCLLYMSKTFYVRFFVMNTQYDSLQYR